MTESVEESKDTQGNSRPANNRPESMRFQSLWGVNHLDNLDKNLIGRILTFELINNRTYTGKLKALGMYDLVITDSRSGQNLIIMKATIVTVQGDILPRVSK